MTKLQIPGPAPDFRLLDQTSTERRLADYRGKWLVLYFYPKDDTPGCTTEACGMREQMAEFDEQAVAVVGVSADSVASHAKFAEKYHLNFPLLADVDRRVIEAYGAWGAKAFGRAGIRRMTYIIDPEGQVVKLFGRVTPLGHARQVLDFIASQTK